MTDKVVDTAELRRLLAEMTPAPWRSGEYAVVAKDRNGYHCEIAHGGWFCDRNGIAALRNAAPALLDEIDALRAKLAESEAACAVLLDHARWMSGASVFGADGEAGEYFQKAVAPALASLPASVRAHMEEDAALREVAREGLALRNSGYDGPCIGEPIAPLFRTLANLDAVRAKGGST